MPTIATLPSAPVKFQAGNQWHAFWNAGDEPARILEVISPAGFERFFEELADIAVLRRHRRRR